MKLLFNKKEKVILQMAELINGDTLYRRLSNSKGIEPSLFEAEQSAGSTLPENYFINVSIKNLSTFFRTSQPSD